MAVKKSKPIEKIQKGDVITIDGKKYEVDSHYVLIDHGATKEMCIELFDPKKPDGEGDYQLRYFNDQAEETLDFYELVKGVMYEKKVFEKIAW
ncbi:MAG: hypothetical protein AABX53_01795 [Nanoarchaeota archaeon]